MANDTSDNGPEATGSINKGDMEHLRKYLDPEFIHAKPDKLAMIPDQYLLQESLDIENEPEVNELLDDYEEQPQETQMLEPRTYQFALFEKALDENVIAVLDTGSGKTLIAVMLIKYMVAKEREERLQRRETKMSFFLVDRVPLVFQQASVIQANTDVNLQMMCGQMDVDNWSEKKWRLIFEENDVCVMTAQIFLDTLRHGFLSMEKVNLLIFDECHHATKRHPYNLIMREFYDRCPKDKRPKIFGMTASPMNSKNDVHSSAIHLERNLDARIYTATDIRQLEMAINKPREITIEYLPSPGFQQTEVTRKVREKLGLIERFRRCFLVTSNTLEHLGPWPCDRLWRHILAELDNRVRIDTHELDKENLYAEDRAVREAFELIKDAAPDNPDLTDPKLFTPKVIKLMLLLRIYSGKWEDFCGIIFVERRDTAIALHLLINGHAQFEGKIKCGVLIGHGTKDEGDSQMKFKEQNRTIQQFRNAEINLLIATNVAEEGLDIQPCNVVIRFDFFSTFIGYIQSRGRARKERSQYIILTEKGNAKEIRTVDEFREKEQQMKSYCKLLPEERNMALKFADSSYDIISEFDDDDDEEDFVDRFYIVESTGATITKQSAVALIHRYCGILPSDGFCVLKPVFEIIPSGGEGFACTLRLPSNAAIREITSEVVKTKGQAKKLAALEACTQLHKLGVLNDHLLPIDAKREILGEMAPQLDENGMIIGSRRRRNVYERRTPKYWGKEEDVEPVDENEEGQVVPDTYKEIHGKATTLDIEGIKRQDVVGTETGINDSLEIIDMIKGNERLTVTNQLVTPHGTGAATNGTLLQTKNGIENADQSPISSSVGESNGMANGTTVVEKSNVEEDVAKDVETEQPEDIGDGPFSLWMTVIDIDTEGGALDDIRLRRLAFLTWKPPFPKLPTFEFFTRGTPFHVSVEPIELELKVSKEALTTLANFTTMLASALTNKEFFSPIFEFPYFFAPLKSTVQDGEPAVSEAESVLEMVDWKEMETALGNQKIPLDLDNIEESVKDRIIIDLADNSRRYFVQAICWEMNPQSSIPTDRKMRETGYENFAAYYKEMHSVEVSRPDQPLLQVRRINKVINYLMPLGLSAPTEKGRTASFVIPEFCKSYSISASVFKSAMILPSIMTRIDSYLLTREAQLRFHLTIKDDLMLEAYTTPSASMKMNYERLETLGDSLLKFLATIRLYINFPFSNEGELHCLRIRVICNRALYRAAKRLKLFRYVTSHAFNRRYWRPHHFVTKFDTPDTLKEVRQHMLSDKTLADIVEATLGAAYLSGGLECGLKAAIAMQIPFDEIQTWSDFLPAYLALRDKVPPRAEIKALRSLSITKIQEITGYTFRTPLLVVEALTHASLPNSTAPCYQRLEFLGDAILDFLVIRYLYNKYPDADPGLITDIKDSCVNNHVLGVICIEVGLHAHIIHYSGKLVRAIEEFYNTIQKMKADGEAIGEYWTDISIPKVLSDVVESMLGAVFVDAGFDLTPVERLFEKWLKPVFDVHVTPETLKIHPLRKFTTDLQRLGCDSFMLRNHTSLSTSAHSQKCVIFLHDQVLATGSADNIKAARRNAATKASMRLEDDPELVSRICTCDIVNRRKRKEAGLDEEEEDEERVEMAKPILQI